MVGWHHRLNGHESEQTPGDSEGQGSLVCPHALVHGGRKESERTEGQGSLVCPHALVHGGRKESERTEQQQIKSAALPLPETLNCAEVH